MGIINSSASRYQTGNIKKSRRRVATGGTGRGTSFVKAAVAFQFQWAVVIQKCVLSHPRGIRI